METALQQVIHCESSQEASEEQPLAAVPSDKTPQEFYAEVTQRADVRAILESLATE